VVGLARSGVAAARALSDRGETVIGVDAGEPRGLEELSAAGVELRPRADGVEALERVNAVIKSPGVPRRAPAIARALAEGKPVLGELELGWRLLANETIAVTGTNGKTTTVELIGHIHRTAGLPVAVAGNVGQALSGLVGRVAPAATIVCEASSFQLEDTLAFAPEAAVLLNIAPDHLDRHGSMEAYAAAKLRVFARQTAADVAVVPAGLDVAIPGEARRVSWDVSAVAEMAGGGGGLRLRGRHNLENAAAALAVCRARGIDEQAIRVGLGTFAGVGHRLEEVARRDGVVYVNDSKATNVASTLVALAAFAGEGVHLILGGQGKGQDFAPLREPVRRGCRAVYLIGEDAPPIAAALAGEGAGRDETGVRAAAVGVPVRECGELERALAAAAAAAKPGEVVLLSPACASFDQFADYEARGERFREIVVGL
jgi:UDP-N-acetylmuramoylalanine--D-glutamate ligase